MRTRNLLSDSEQEEQEDGGGDDESLQAIRYSGMLRKKKEDHGMFEDPYKTMCMATLDDGILTLKMIVNGEVTDSQEMYNLGDGWKLIIRDDKKDRFSLIRSSGSSSEPTQITLKAENRMEGEAWIEKLTETARWFGECIRQVNAAHEQQEEQSRPQTKKGEQCGIGMVLRQTKDGLIVIKLAPGAPAAASNQIELEDILLKVDGKAVSTAEEAAECILGDKGSEIHLLFQRVVGGKKVKFPVRLIRGKV
uniref:PDZ domain-containing protein n=1 Tax=Guillardia theta TaxID=55529 RepID=A0A7S4H9C8_GUITH|mmetsp:Transcript_11281/g.38540  ORF Transcript_11281/g.38540 Transcript_11281/m.38540 type:complete len:250 (+) Transcript_11281:118-867(+)